MPPRYKKPAPPPPPPPTPIKILMLHGYTQSGPLFRSKTRAVEKLLTKALAADNLVPVLSYPTAPIRLRPQDIPGYEPKPDEPDDPQPDCWGWWLHDADGNYPQFERGMASLAAPIAEAGGIDAVLGFSQGAGAAAFLAAALEQPPRAVPPEAAEWVGAVRAANQHRPLRFAIIYSGFLPTPKSLAWLYEPRITTPTLHIRGNLDTIVDESRSEGLAQHCVDSEMIVHPGSHYVPVARDKVLPLVPFIKKHSEGLKDTEKTDAEDSGAADSGAADPKGPEADPKAD